MRQLGADYIFTKTQENYSPQLVLDFLRTTKKLIINRKPIRVSSSNDNSPTIAKKKLHIRICTELNKVGISPKSTGYKYLIDAIEITYHDPQQHICAIIGSTYGKTEASVQRAIQAAIERAWKRSAPSDLLENYKNVISSEKGCPTVMEFIYYYAQVLQMS